MALYDQYYKDDKNYFGNAHPPLIEFFTSYTQKGSVVDLGAGQGRNSIPLHELGYDVTAVDISQVGLEQINAKYPEIKTMCHDIYNFDISSFDCVLLDSMLHFYKKEFEKEQNLVKTIFDNMKKNSIFVNCMVYSHHHHLIKLINSYPHLQVIKEDTFYYANHMKYHMIVLINKK